MKIFTHFSTVPMAWNITTPNPKNYPYAEEFLKLLRTKADVVEVTWKPMAELIAMIKTEMDTFVSIDSFLPHMAHYYGKLGFVIFGQSDPKLFGYQANINILKDKKYLREKQFERWEQTPCIAEAFPTAEELFYIINQYI